MDEPTLGSPITSDMVVANALVAKHFNHWATYTAGPYPEIATEGLLRTIWELRDAMARNLGIPQRLVSGEQERPMTEADWLGSTDPFRMVHWLRSVNAPDSANLPLHPCPMSYPPRKYQLFAEECARRAGISEPDIAAYSTYGRGGRDPENWAMAWAGDQKVPSPAERADLLRCIFGNPWRPVLIWPGKAVQMLTHIAEPVVPYIHSSILAWRDRTVPRIAAAIHDERRWEDMPILGDALEEAGAECEELLQHLRGWKRCGYCKDGYHETGLVKCDAYGIHDSRRKIRCVGCQGTGWVRTDAGHARGCWAVELLLGRE